MSRRTIALVGVLMALAFADSAHAAGSATLVGEPDRTLQATQQTPECDSLVLVCIGGSIIGKVGDVVGDVVSSGASAASNTVMNGIVSWAAEGAAWLVGEIAVQIDRSTRPALTSGWFLQRYSSMVQLAVLLSALFLLFAIGEAIVAQDVSKLIRSAFIALPYALFLTFAAVLLVEIGLTVTDWMTASTLQGSKGDVREAFQAMGTVLTAAPGTQMAPFVVFLGATVTALLGLLVWLELVMREAAIYVAVPFLPLTLAAMVWERTSHWVRRLAEWLLALILSKFTIAATFSLASAAITEAPSGGGGLSAMLAGCAILLVAALTPWALLRMIPMAEAAAGRTLTRGSVRGATNSVPGVATATAATRMLLLKNVGGGSGSAGVARASAAGAPVLASQSQPPASPGAAPLPQLASGQVAKRLERRQ